MVSRWAFTSLAYDEDCQEMSPLFCFILLFFPICRQGWFQPDHLARIDAHVPKDVGVKTYPTPVF